MGTARFIRAAYSASSGAVYSIVWLPSRYRSHRSQRSGHPWCPVPASPEEDEYIEVIRLPLETALEMILDGRITDAKTICALHLAAARDASSRT